MQPETAPRDTETVLEYHEATKHQVHRYARSLGYLDWAAQPSPFRIYDGATLVPLDEVHPGDEPTLDAAFTAGRLEPRSADRAAVSQLLYDSLSISAWKEFRGSQWSLRVNPSSGDLHPTEGYLVSGPLPGLLERPSICHYSVFHHALEVRAELSGEEWRDLGRGLPAGALLLGLTSIYWREAWKYGERAFRYCQHDVGHAIGALAIAAAILGWESRLLEGVPDDEIAALLGVRGQQGPEAEHPDCLMALFPAGTPFTVGDQLRWRFPRALLDRLSVLAVSGEPNRLSSSHHEWPTIESVSAATLRTRAPPEAFRRQGEPPERAVSFEDRSISARAIVRGRRSAVAMDGSTRISSEAFFRIIERTLPVRGRPPFDVLPWDPAIHLVLFVHRVDGLAPGLYFLPRSSGAAEELRARTRREFLWSRPGGCPGGIDLHLLLADDVREAAQAVCCHQEIASDGAFAVAMLADYVGTLRRIGPWFYRRLHWEAGAVGQALYLEAEAAGVRGTGIGCFFDDLLHDLMGLEDRSFQSLYHFTIGGFLDDTRIRTLPSYFHRPATDGG